MKNIHSCSYSCDRPECIKAQRDELAAAAMQAAVGMDAYDDALDQLWKLAGGNDHPVYKRFLGFRDSFSAQPATAQEAVGEVSEWDGSLCVQWVPNYEPPVGTKLYASPITATPGIDLEQFRELQKQLVSEAETAELNELEADSIGLTEAANRQALRSKLLFNVAIRLGTLIDANSKGALNEQFGSAE